MTGHTSSVNSLAILPDQSIVSGSNDFSLKIWSLNKDNKKSLIRTLTGHTDFVTTVVVLKDGKRLASAGYDSSILIWNVTDGEVIRNLTDNKRTIYRLCVLNENTILSSLDETLIIWNVNTGELVKKIKVDYWLPFSAFVVLDENRLVSAGAYEMWIWNMTDWSQIKKIQSINILLLLLFLYK